MSDRPLVCICIPTYNAAGTVRETLASILAQTYPNLVVHVSDNASTDDTVKVIESLADPRIVMHRHAINVGAEGNFNHCIQLAEGKYTAIFHADDIYEPEMVERQVAFLETHRDAGAVFTEARTIDEFGRTIGNLTWPNGLKSDSPLYDFRALLKGVMRDANFFVCPSAMVRTLIYQKEIKKWRGDLFGSGADLDVWFRIAQNHSIGLIAYPLMQYRISSTQFSARVRAETERAIVFDILDYYFADAAVKKLVDVQDWLNYSNLQRRDRVGRAINLLLIDRSREASDLCHDIFTNKALYAAITTKRGLFTWLAGAYLRLIIAAGMMTLGKTTLTYLKRKTFK